MKLSKKEIKQRYFDKIYANAPMVKCLCGCGTMMKSKDEYGRDKTYLTGHNDKKYNDPTQYKREWNHQNREKGTMYQKECIHRQKKKLIEDAGGKCMVCGLPFDGDCSAIFDFHHRNPNEKLFCINNGSLNKYGIKKVAKEAAKCDLVCANCHRLIHWNWKEYNTASPEEGLPLP